MKMGKNKKKIYILFIALPVLFFVLFNRASFGGLFIIANLLTVMAIVYLSKLYKKTGKPIFQWVSRISTIAYSIFLVSFFIVEGFIISEWQQSKKVNPEKIDFVIILGAGLNGDKPSKTLETRLEAGVAFLKKNPELPVVVSGGQGPGERISEARAMGKYLKENGIADQRIYYEEKSTTTDENLKYSQEVIAQAGIKDPRVLIVTNNYHLLRAKMIARDLGLQSYGIGANSPLFVTINYFIREYFGIIKVGLDSYTFGR